MMELLVSHGADVNAVWDGWFPIIFAPCESVNPVSLRWLIEHGANPNATNPRETRYTSRGSPDTPLDYLIGSYGRSPELGACIDILLDAGGKTKYDVPALLALLRGRVDQLADELAADPALARRQFPTFTFGSTGGRQLLLTGATLLHVAAEYQNIEAATLLLDRGADVNARAMADDAGVGGQTAIFHSVTQFEDDGLPMTRLLIDRGADVSIRVKLPGHYERPGEVIECTPFGYARRIQDQPDGPPERPRTLALLRERGAAE
jgi:hypothetical protein